VSLQKGQILELEISDLSHDGRGVAHINNFAIFVPGALPGERAEVQVTEVKKRYGQGLLLKIISPSSARVEPSCPVYPLCGGCQIQHLSYPEQLAAKQRRVAEALKRIGKLQGTVLPIIGMDNPWQYRNKALLPFAKTASGEILLGCFEKGTHNVVDIKCCLIQHEAQQTALAKVRELVRKYNLSIYDERTGKGLLRHLLVRTGFRTGEMLLGLVTTKEPFPKSNQFAAELADSLDGLVGVVRNINDKRTNVILGHETKLLWGRPVLYDEILGVRYTISATSFFQVNPVGMEVLYQKVLDAAGKFSTAVDAYCGIGSIALLLAQKGEKVFGIEVVPSAISDAKANAQLNGIDNAAFLEGKVEDVLPQLIDEDIDLDLAVLDPPRKGCDEIVLDAIAKAEIPKVVYVSCNPSTLARDLAVLAQKGYETKWVQPVDMFPQTFHVECVVLMSRVEK
jgi:23S rRNA (uracil1939-C5)-methyltransferase